MRTAAEWLGVLLLLGAWTWAVGSFFWSYGFREGQRVQDTAYGQKLDVVIEALDCFLFGDELMVCGDGRHFALPKKQGRR